MEHPAIRHHLLHEQRRLVRYFHAALELADRDLVGLATEDGAITSQLWSTHVVALLGSRLYDLHDVIAALDRLDTGTYGICTTCGGDIDPLILDRIPTTTDCDDCVVTRDMVAIPAHA